jgi:hypothetical protein
MSGFLFITGIFGVRAGKLDDSPRSSRHIIYQSAIAGTTGALIASTIRVYSRSAVILKDHTAVLVMGKLYAPRGGTPSIDTSGGVFAPFPGDPEDALYEERLPSFDNPIVLGVGPVNSPLQPLPSADSNVLQEFGLEVSQFFIDVVKLSMIK